MDNTNCSRTRYGPGQPQDMQSTLTGHERAQSSPQETYHITFWRFDLIQEIIQIKIKFVPFSPKSLHHDDGAKVIRAVWLKDYTIFHILY